jgi:uncharacterized alpha-E superfamily protein
MKIGKHGLEKADERSMKKNMDVDFYKKHDFSNEMREAVNSGRGIVSENMTPDQFFAMARIGLRPKERATKTLMNEVLEAALA